MWAVLTAEEPKEGPIHLLQKGGSTTGQGASRASNEDKKHQGASQGRATREGAWDRAYAPRSIRTPPPDQQRPWLPTRERAASKPFMGAQRAGVRGCRQYPLFLITSSELRKRYSSDLWAWVKPGVRGHRQGERGYRRRAISAGPGSGEFARLCSDYIDNVQRLHQRRAGCDQVHRPGTRSRTRGAHAIDRRRKKIDTPRESHKGRTSRREDQQLHSAPRRGKQSRSTDQTKRARCTRRWSSKLFGGPERLESADLLVSSVVDKGHAGEDRRW